MNPRDIAQPKRRRPRQGEKPPMPKNLEPIAAKAIERHKKRHANPGVVVTVDKDSGSYQVDSPHSDRNSWEAMICDALGTRSVSHAKTFLIQLTELCSKCWRDDQDENGAWYPDADELNMILNFVAGVKPRNEMQAALAAQMCAVHLMTMKVAGAAMVGWGVDPNMAGMAGKLAHTFAIQCDAMSKLKGCKVTRQHIKVSYEKHEHKHIHVDRGAGESGGQPREARGAGEPAKRPALPCPQQVGEVVPFPRGEGEEGLPAPRRQRIGRTKR